eukprot:TRINITY_DN1057_c0_g1_i2.p1 TRINITY_DN1057_c0_g1~~TRINITY_DN1057_c0_g1_i2.p1  ORF type:complete len:184 (+),score=14.26 TRINITY_DN1057_c0_g1_i2:273-824(+)
MQEPPMYYEKGDYIETLTGNKVSRKSVLCGSMNIRLHGKTIIKPGAVIRGDLANVIVGRLSLIGDNTVIRPSYKRFKSGIAFFPLTIGDHVTIDEGSVVEAASIGSYVSIGKNCIISKRCIIKDCSSIPDNTILAADTVVPPFTEYRGAPGLFYQELQESWIEVQKEKTTSYYERFQAVQTQK